MEYRIFIAYRGKSEGFKFAKALYDDIHTDTQYLEKYGGVYFSVKSKIVCKFFQVKIVKA